MSGQSPEKGDRGQFSKAGNKRKGTFFCDLSQGVNAPSALCFVKTLKSNPGPQMSLGSFGACQKELQTFMWPTCRWWEEATSLSLGHHNNTRRNCDCNWWGLFFHEPVKSVSGFFPLSPCQFLRVSLWMRNIVHLGSDDLGSVGFQAQRFSANLTPQRHPSSSEKSAHPKHAQPSIFCRLFHGLPAQRNWQHEISKNNTTVSGQNDEKNLNFICLAWPALQTRLVAIESQSACLFWVILNCHPHRMNQFSSCLCPITFPALWGATSAGWDWANMADEPAARNSDPASETKLNFRERMVPCKALSISEKLLWQKITFVTWMIIWNPKAEIAKVWNRNFPSSVDEQDLFAVNNRKNSVGSSNSDGSPINFLTNAQNEVSKCQFVTSVISRSFVLHGLLPSRAAFRTLSTPNWMLWFEQSSFCCHGRDCAHEAQTDNFQLCSQFFFWKRPTQYQLPSVKNWCEPNISGRSSCGRVPCLWPNTYRRSDTAKPGKIDSLMTLVSSTDSHMWSSVCISICSVRRRKRKVHRRNTGARTLPAEPDVALFGEECWYLLSKLINTFLFIPQSIFAGRCSTSRVINGLFSSDSSRKRAQSGADDLSETSIQASRWH